MEKKAVLWYDRGSSGRCICPLRFVLSRLSLHRKGELKKYAKLYPGDPLPHITPHVLLHTFCTDMANAGLDIKSLQYVMGHSGADITLNVYTHASYDRAAEQMRQLTA